MSMLKNIVNSLLDNIIYKQKRIKIIFFLFSCLLLFLVGYFFTANRLNNKLTIVKQSNNELIKKLTTQQQQLNKLLNYKQKIAKMGIVYEQLKNQLNQKIDIALVIKELAKTAINNSIELNSVRPLPVNKKSLVIIYPLQINANGSYKNFSSFAKDLIDLPYFAILQDIKIIKSEDNYNFLNIQALILIYGTISL